MTKIESLLCTASILFILSMSIIDRGETKIEYTSRLVHRFSDELREFSGDNSTPELNTVEYYRRLLIGDLGRQKFKLKLAYHQRQLLFPSQGAQTFPSGNDLGWLHYTWIDIGTPSVSFLVAVDDGSDLLWVPCDCVQCAPLSAINYSDQDKKLNEYSPDVSSTSKQLMCSHQLCNVGSECKSPTQSCPYTVQYRSENTSSSGQLVEDFLHLSSSNSPSKAALKASIIFGCGKRQSGDYLDGIAPDGVMGLGLGEISVPSLLAKSGLINNSFSLCFNDNGSGRIFFGDQGSSSHHWTPLLPLDGKYSTYVVGVDALCVGKSSCLKQTSFHAVIDSGTSFTFLPFKVYAKAVQEFDRETNAARANFELPWEYCYESSGQISDFPSVKLMLSNNESFVVQSPIFIFKGSQGILGYCLALQVIPGDIAIIGQNFMTGYRMVFDRENMQFGWSRSDCKEHNNGTRGSSSLTGTLPTDEQQSRRGGHAVAPAIAGRAPSKTSDASALHASVLMFLATLICLLISYHVMWH
ncbi:hypothetical protein KSS87_020352 [Heliosperma pusillum]|nr:hypothetical protein KSS87_020352 [Heliosperma pusillum]